MKRITISFALTSFLFALISMSTFSVDTDPGTPGTVAKKKTVAAKKNHNTGISPLAI